MTMMYNAVFRVLVMDTVLMLCSCASVKTSVEKGPFESKEKSLWTIHSESNYFTFEESVLNDARKQAAEKSNSEGMDCFVSDDRIYPREAITTRTMYGKLSDGSSFSYQVPDELHYSNPSALLFVSFHNYDECKKIEKTKGQEKVFYNNETIKNAKWVEKKNLMKEILLWGSSIGIIVLLMLL